MRVALASLAWASMLVACDTAPRAGAVDVAADIDVDVDASSGDVPDTTPSGGCVTPVAESEWPLIPEHPCPDNRVVQYLPSLGCALRAGGEVGCADPLRDDLGPLLDYDDVAQVEVGEHACLLRRCGQLVCWQGSEPVSPSLTVPEGRYVDVVVGWDHTCALDAEGEVTCVGGRDAENNDLLGAPEGPFVALDGGSLHTCGLRADGRVACWPDVDFDQDVRISVMDAGGDRGACGLLEDGAVVCAGEPWGNPLRPVPEGRFESVAVAGTWACGVRVGGALECWGYSWYDERDPPPGDGFVAMASPTCAWRRDGELVCWGPELDGVEDPPAHPAVSIDAGWAHHCALGADGAARCWGTDVAGETDAPEGIFVAVEAGRLMSCGLGVDGLVTCWGDFESESLALFGVGAQQLSVGMSHVCVLDQAAEAWCFLDDLSQSDVTPPDGPFEALSSGTSASCGLRGDGTVACWGAIEASPPGRYSAISVGGVGGCGIQRDDPAVASCWDRSGEIVHDIGFGDAVLDLDRGPSETCGLVPASGQHRCVDNAWGSSTMSVAVPSVPKAVAVSVGETHICALSATGEVACGPPAPRLPPTCGSEQRW